VNDVAAVNIDAKLIRNQQFVDAEANPGIKELAPTIELENGCACASLHDLRGQGGRVHAGRRHQGTGSQLSRLQAARSRMS